MNKKHRLIAVILTICMLVPMSSSIFATENVTMSSTITAEQTSPSYTETTDISETPSFESTTESTLLDDCAILNYVDTEAFNNAGHIARLPELETLSSYAFQNADGTRTIYYLDHPVKYIDDTGEIQEIDLALQEDNNVFRTTANSVHLEISKDVTEGISLTQGSFTVQMIALPDTTNSDPGQMNTSTMVATQFNENAITYQNLFGDGIDVRYTPTYNGVKEDIVLSEYTGISSFNFLLKTDGLTVYEEEGQYFLAESADSEERILIGDIIAYDAEIDMHEGTLSVIPLKESQLYQLVVSVDDDFLTAPDTVYPVLIDPTLTVSDNSHGANAIQDCPVYSGRPTKNHGSYVYNRAGYADSTYGTGRTAVRLYGLYTDAVYTSIPESYINSVLFYVKDSSGGSEKTVNIHALTSKGDWTESELTWNTLGTFTSSVLCSAAIGNTAWKSFNITSLVKGWKKGTYNATYGFVMKGANESLDCNFFASEASTTSNRPYVVMTYTATIILNAAKVSISEGLTYELTATTYPSNLTVSWKSSNEAVATINSIGTNKARVTALRSGQTTVTATVTDTSGKTHSAQCTIDVRIAAGVYYITNLNSNYVLYPEDGKYAHNTNVLQAVKLSDTASNVYRIRQMWKIVHLGDGRYSIRPMHKLDRGLNVANSNVNLNSIGTKDTLSDIVDTSEWVIEWDSTGYVFKNKGDSNKTMQVENASTAVLANVIASTYSQSANCKWKLTKIVNPPAGAVLYNTSTQQPATYPTKYLTPNETSDMFQMELLAAAYTSSSNISQTFTWTTNAPGIATVDSGSGTVTGVTEGTATITGTSVHGYTVSYTVIVTAIENGAYFLKNKQSGYYADIKGPTMADGTTIHQWKFHGDDSERWIFEHLGNGYYTIKSVNSSTAYYLGVINDSSGLDVDIVLRSGSITSGMKWKIESTASGAYKLIPQSGASKGYVLNTTASGATNGAKLTQSTYILNNSYMDEWYLLPITNAYSIGGTCFDNPEEEAPRVGQEVVAAAEAWKECGYDSYCVTDPNANILNETTLNSSIVYFSSHGSQHSIQLLSNDTFPNLFLADNKATETSQMRRILDYTIDQSKLYIYDACSTASTADGSGTNLCTATLQAGAECVIGWTTKIYLNDTDKWQQRFQSMLISGFSVEQSAMYANSFIYEHDANMKSYRIFGNKDLIINIDRPQNTVISDSNYIANLSIPYSYASDYSYTTLKNILNDYFDANISSSYQVTKTHFSDNSSDYVLDCTYLNGGLITNSGYTIIVKNNTIVAIRDNTIISNNASAMTSDNNTLSTDALDAPVITQEIIDNAYALAARELVQMNSTYTIAEQTGEGYYDMSTSICYYRVSTVYQTSGGTYGAFTTYYPI